MGILDRVQDNDYIHFAFNPNPDQPTLRRWALRTECRHCKKPGEYKLTAGHSTCSQGFADRAFRARGWLIGPSRAADTCPECVGAAKRRLAEKAEAAKAEEAQKDAQIRERTILPAIEDKPGTPLQEPPKKSAFPAENRGIAARGTGFSGNVARIIDKLPIGTECTSRSIADKAGAKGNSQETMTTQTITKAVRQGLLEDVRKDNGKRVYRRVEPKVVGHDEPQPYADDVAPRPTVLEAAADVVEAVVEVTRRKIPLKIEPVIMVDGRPEPLVDGRVQQLVEEGERKFDELIAAVEKPPLPSPVLRELLGKPEPQPLEHDTLRRPWTAKDRDLQSLLDSVLKLATDIRDMEPPEPQKGLDDYTMDELLDAIALKRMK